MNNTSTTARTSRLASNKVAFLMVSFTFLGLVGGTMLTMGHLGGLFSVPVVVMVAPFVLGVTGMVLYSKSLKAMSDKWAVDNF